MCQATEIWRNLMQATMQTPPSPLSSMMRGLCAAYSVVLLAYFPVASAGYAAFGNVVSPDVLLSVRNPAWLISMANFMVVVHLAAAFQVCSPAALCLPCAVLLLLQSGREHSHHNGVTLI
jgi:hypothetical protein